MDIDSKPCAIETQNAPLPIGPYSQAVTYGGFVFCSGQIPIDPNSGTIPDVDASAQADIVLRNLGQVLQAAGSSYSAVVKTTIFLTDMSTFPGVNEVYGKFFGATKPARSTVEVKSLPKGASVEIEAVAIQMR